LHSAFQATYAAALYSGRSRGALGGCSKAMLRDSCLMIMVSSASIFSLRPIRSPLSFFSLESHIIKSPTNRPPGGIRWSLLSLVKERIGCLGIVLVGILALLTAHSTAALPADVFLVLTVEAGDPVSHLEIRLLTTGGLTGVVGGNGASSELEESDSSIRVFFFLLLPFER
jgi:hypothetical protein